MIGQIEGALWYKGERYLIIGAGGIGYKLFATEETIDGIANEKLRFWIYESIREDTHDLYGFLDQEELRLFEMLVSISGIGPRKALAIMSMAPLAILKKAIVKSDLAYLTKVSGIGRKNAEKIIMELKEKIVLSKDEEVGHLKEDTDVIETIKALGYSGKEAREALRQISEDTRGVSNRVKEALKVLGKS